MDECFCTRKDIKEEIERSGEAPHHTPEGPIYPGICKKLTNKEIQQKMDDNIPYALRLDVTKALSLIDDPLSWHDLTQGDQLAKPEEYGDVVLARKDIPVSYHLCVTLDDHLQNISLVTRCDELFYATNIHRLLQALLDLDVPYWDHHKILNDEDGNRLAKRDKSISLKHLREEEHLTPQDIFMKVRIAL